VTEYRGPGDRSCARRRDWSRAAPGWAGAQAAGLVSRGVWCAVVVNAVRRFRAACSDVCCVPCERGSLCALCVVRSV